MHLGTGVKVVEVCGGEGQRGVVRLEDFNGHSWKADKVRYQTVYRNDINDVIVM